MSKILGEIVEGIIKKGAREGTEQTVQEVAERALREATERGLTEITAATAREAAEAAFAKGGTNTAATATAALEGTVMPSRAGDVPVFRAGEAPAPRASEIGGDKLGGGKITASKPVDPDGLRGGAPDVQAAPEPKAADVPDDPSDLAEFYARIDAEEAAKAAKVPEPVVQTPPPLPPASQAHQATLANDAILVRAGDLAHSKNKEVKAAYGVYEKAAKKLDGIGNEPVPSDVVSKKHSWQNESTKVKETVRKLISKAREYRINKVNAELDFFEAKVELHNTSIRNGESPILVDKDGNPLGEIIIDNKSTIGDLRGRISKDNCRELDGLAEEIKVRSRYSTSMPDREIPETVWRESTYRSNNDRFVNATSEALQAINSHNPLIYKVLGGVFGPLGKFSEKFGGGVLTGAGIAAGLSGVAFLGGWFGWNKLKESELGKTATPFFEQVESALNTMSDGLKEQNGAKENGEIKLDLPSTPKAGEIDLDLPTTPENGEIRLDLPPTPKAGEIELDIPSIREGGVDLPEGGYLNKARESDNIARNTATSPTAIMEARIAADNKPREI